MHVAPLAPFLTRKKKIGGAPVCSCCVSAGAAHTLHGELRDAVPEGSPAGMLAGLTFRVSTRHPDPRSSGPSVRVSSRTVVCDPLAAVPPQEERNPSHACSSFAGSVHLRRSRSDSRLSSSPPLLSWRLRPGVLRPLLRYLLRLRDRAKPHAATGSAGAHPTDADKRLALERGDCSSSGIGRSVAGGNTGAGDRPRTDRSRDCTQPGTMPALSRLS
jgi:hypothetical protein